jgi:L-threonylcarbamoyladenylate synthase
MFQLDDIVETLKSGGTILYPTDTVWGIGCDATDPEAIEKIYKIKQRPTNKGLIILVSNHEMLTHYVDYIHPRIETLLSFHTRPLTVIYDNPIHIASNALAPDGSIAIRIVQDAFCRQIIQQFGKPIVSTSANLSGEKFPNSFSDINQIIIDQVDFTVKFKQERKESAEPSQIVRLNKQEELDFIRE